MGAVRTTKLKYIVAAHYYAIITFSLSQAASNTHQSLVIIAFTEFDLHQ